MEPFDIAARCRLPEHENYERTKAMTRLSCNGIEAKNFSRATGE